MERSDTQQTARMAAQDTALTMGIALLHPSYDCGTAVGWVERSDTQQTARMAAQDTALTMGIALLHPSYDSGTDVGWVA